MMKIKNKRRSKMIDYIVIKDYYGYVIGWYINDNLILI